MHVIQVYLDHRQTICPAAQQRTCDKSTVPNLHRITQDTVTQKLLARSTLLTCLSLSRFLEFTGGGGNLVFMGDIFGSLQTNGNQQLQITVNVRDLK